MHSWYLFDGCFRLAQGTTFVKKTTLGRQGSGRVYKFLWSKSGQTKARRKQEKLNMKRQHRAVQAQARKSKECATERSQHEWIITAPPPNPYALGYAAFVECNGGQF